MAWLVFCVGCSLFHDVWGASMINNYTLENKPDSVQITVIAYLN
jgi:hypothetical protein